MQQELTKLIGRHIKLSQLRESQNTQENDYILTLYIFLASFFIRRSTFRFLLLIYTILRVSKTY